MNLEEWLNEVPPADWVEPEDVSGHLLSREQLESLWQAAHAEGVAEGRAAERKKWQDENSTLRKRLETRTQISRQWEALAERNRLERTAATAAERGLWELVIQAAIADLCPICARGGKEPVYHSQSNGWYHRDGPPGNWCMAGRVRSMVRVIKEADDE